MKSLRFKILDQIPKEHIYRYLEQQNASKKQISGERVGSDAAGRKAKKNAIAELAHNIAK